MPCLSATNLSTPPTEPPPSDAPQNFISLSCQIVSLPRVDPRASWPVLPSAIQARIDDASRLRHLRPLDDLVSLLKTKLSWLVHPQVLEVNLNDPRLIARPKFTKTMSEPFLTVPEASL